MPDDESKRPPGASPGKLSILIVSAAWTTEPLHGGVRRHVITLVRELKESHNITVLVPDWERKRLTCERIDGVTVYRRRLAVAPTSAARLARKLVSWLINLPGTLLALRRIAREEKIDVVHLHQVTAGAYFNFWVLRKLGGPRYVVGFHGRETRDYKGSAWLWRWQMDRLVHDAAHGIPVSQDLANIGKTNGWRIEHATVIPNGAVLPDLVEAAASDELEAQSLSGPYFVMLGRVHEVKGQDLAVQAWKWVSKELPDVHLVIVGDYAAEPAYERLVEETGCKSNIHFVGRQPHDAALRWLKGATGLIQSSRNEGGCAPYAILEAAMLCVPVIASGIPSLREVIEHERSGLVVAPENPEAIASAVIRLARDADLASRLGKSLSQHVHSDLTAARMAEKYAAVYLDAATRAR